MADTKVAAAEEALAKMADMIGALPENHRNSAMFKANKLMSEAANIAALPDGARQEIAVEWLAKGDEDGLRKAAADAAGLVIEDEAEAQAEEGKETEASAEATAEEEDEGEPSDEDIEAWLGTLSDEEMAELVAELDAEEEDLPDEFYDVVAQMSDEEIELAHRYLAEAQKMDAMVDGEPMNKADAMADAWLDRGDEDMKKFVGAAMGAMRSAGAFSRAVAGRAGAGIKAGAQRAGAGRAGRTFGFGSGGKAARDEAYMGVLRNRTAVMQGIPGNRKTVAMSSRGTELANRASNKVGAGQRRNRMAAGAIGTGVLGGGGALFASRRKK